MAKKSKRKLIAVILAAGQGTRMKSQRPKVLHSICGTPMIDHVLDSLQPLKPDEVYVITGHLHDEVKAHVGSRAECILQKDRLGTAHAVKMARRKFANKDADVLIMCGDAPLIKTETVEALLHRRRSHHTACVVLTTTLPDPTGYGRIVRNRDNTVRKIVEHKDTNTYEEKIDEINTGTYCFDAQDLAWAINRVSNKNAQKEYYLTDVVEIFQVAGKEVEAVVCEDPTEVVGVNSRRDMAQAERFLRARINNRIMDEGVTIVDPQNTYIDNTVKIGRDTKILPFTIIEGATQIGEGCRIGPNCSLHDARLNDGVVVRNSIVEDATVGKNVQIGPYAHIRPGTKLPAGARIGTFEEISQQDLDEDYEMLDLHSDFLLGAPKAEGRKAPAKKAPAKKARKSGAKKK
ncbi:bifunctional UDP-N-acetylglucosamine diphosphorylase/glucosamine-1-phosphate N-acetyltransferase GlmU [bacterium]|nr:bifunctional UDP-N-acetylglucosamine diphosphorylase/glucosamine-1-phosphate N-acetyltransferase GlmU [bacterium]